MATRVCNVPPRSPRGHSLGSTVCATRCRLRKRIFVMSPLRSPFFLTFFSFFRDFKENHQHPLHMQTSRIDRHGNQECG